MYIEHLKAEAKGEIQQYTIVEPQCELQCEHTEKARLGLAAQGASMDHDHHAPVMS